MNKDYHQVWEQRAWAYHELKQFKNAIADYTQAIAIRPKWGDNYDARGQCHAELRQFDLADADFQSAMKCSDDEATFWYHHGLLRPALNDQAGYRERLRRMVEAYKEPIYFGTIANIVWSHALTADDVTDWKPFLELLAKGEENLGGHDRSDYHFVRTYGAALYRAGKYSEAVKKLEEAVKLQSEPKPVTAWLFLAMANQRLGKTEEAKKWLDKADAIKQEESSWRDRATVEILRAALSSNGG